MTKQPAVYLLASKRNGTLYTGVTSNLPARIWQHKNDLMAGFTKKYQVHQLVYFERHEGMAAAIQREKQIKKWRRQWKLELIEQNNPDWKYLFNTCIVPFHENDLNISDVIFFW
jgi:putative endonuclease